MEYTEEMEMPTPCIHCGNLFDLLDGYGSEKWHPNTTICTPCHGEEETEIERDEEIDNINEVIFDAEATIQGCLSRIREVEFISPELSGSVRIMLERERQLEEEGWIAEHDDKLTDGELANAAATYALTDESRSYVNDMWGQDNWLHFWPFDLKSLKLHPEDRIRQLSKAGALIAAEIDRLSRIKSY